MGRQINGYMVKEKEGRQVEIEKMRTKLGGIGRKSTKEKRMEEK